MHSMILDSAITKGRLRSFLKPDVNDVVSSLQRARPMPTSTEDLQNVRLALAEAEQMIRTQEDRIRQLEDLALSDELTGTLNRRGFMAAMQRELAYAKRDKSAFGALLMIDLDRFKIINDTWGHNAGDEYLKAASGVLMANVRANDFVARLGGDEFALILTRIDRKNAEQRLLDISRDFNCQVVEWGGFVTPLRGSFGMAVFDGARSVEEVMADADSKLYAQKEQRRKGTAQLMEHTAS